MTDPEVDDGEIESSSAFTISLRPTGDDGSSFRMQNMPGQLQRPNVAQQDISSLTVKAELFAVVHGRYTPGGEWATLVVIDFHFLGSRPQSRRFRDATVDVSFTREGQLLGRDSEPVVCAIAPNGSFTMNASTQEHERTFSADSRLGLVGNLDIGAGFERRTLSETKGYATLYGSKRVHGRTWGSHNTARWSVNENDLDKLGIPAFLRTAVLIKPETKGKFQAHFTIETRVGVVHDFRTMIEKFRGKTVVDPVCFGIEEERESLGPTLIGVDVDNLSCCDLSKIAIAPEGEKAGGA